MIRTTGNYTADSIRAALRLLAEALDFNRDIVQTAAAKRVAVTDSFEEMYEPFGELS